MLHASLIETSYSESISPLTPAPAAISRCAHIPKRYNPCRRAPQTAAPHRALAFSAMTGRTLQSHRSLPDGCIERGPAPGLVRTRASPARARIGPNRSGAQGRVNPAPGRYWARCRPRMPRHAAAPQRPCRFLRGESLSTAHIQTLDGNITRFTQHGLPPMA